MLRTLQKKSRAVIRAASGPIAAVVGLVLLVSAGTAAYAGASGKVYIVRPGDTLWAISRANGLTVDRLASANGINPNNFLLIGRQLVIPSNTPPPNPAAGSTAASPQTFCSTFVPVNGPWGVLPNLLRQSPDRLALRPIFHRWASYYNLNLPLLEAVAWQESGWQQRVKSSAGAIGAGQLMPETANFISGFLIGAPMNINSVSDNIRMSAAFLAYLAGVEGNNRCKTIAAYYEGPLNLSRVGAFTDTQAYVASVEALIPEFS